MQLEALQQSMIAAIDLGPDYVVDSAFLGGRAAALRGLAVHANTISHARLVAIEETFPRTRESLGEERFNALSQTYLDRPRVAAEAHSAIGRHLPAFLGEAGYDDSAALAAFEWAWLEAYHAAEAEALALSGLAGLSEEELLQTCLALHPAARMTRAIRNEVLEIEVPGICDAPAVLITRPEAEVLVAPASPVMQRQFEILGKGQPVCNLLECGGELAGEDSMKALIALLGAGSLVLA